MPARQSIIPLWSAGMKGRSVNATTERRVNLYLDRDPGGGDKSPLALYSRPGLERKYFTGPASASSTPGGPIRGIVWQVGTVITPTQGVVYGAQGRNTILAVTLSQFLTSSDPVYLTQSGPVQFAAIGIQTVAVDGVTGYYVANGTTMQQEGVTDFPAASSICTLAQRFIVNDPSAVGRFRYSEVSNALSWPALNFATAESAEDPLSLVFSIRGELLLFGTKTIEFWQPTSDPDLPFQAVIGASEEWGLGFFDSVRDVNGTCMFVGRAGGAGQPQVCRLNGYQVEVVSTPDVDYAIGLEVEAGAVPCATVVTHSGHAWYVLNMKNTSFAFDTLNGTWCEWQTEGARWAGQYTFTYRGITFVTDYRDGRVYVLDADRYQDDTAPILRQLYTRHVFSSLERITVDRLQLDLEVGVGLSSGQGSDPLINMALSKDGGHTYGEERQRPLGAQGKYRVPVAWNGLGQGTDFAFRLTIPDPVKVVMLNGALVARQ